MNVLEPVVLDRPLSVAMREGSQAQHTAAENASFTSELLEGRINEQGYVDYLLCLTEVYGALEAVGRELAGDPIAAAVLDPDLDRAESLANDLAYWAHRLPSDSATASASPSASPAAAAYAERVGASATSPLRFVAHHYTRYLGDLSGGQVIGRILDRTFDLQGCGVAFYDFAAIAKPKPYKDRYRARLDALDLSVEERQVVVDEVKVAFRLNQDLFEELGQNLDAYRR
ncbi:biliverdin-producing heme oxygenase [Nocardioides pacificus]